MPNHYALPERRIGSISSPVGTQIPQATGVALGAKISGKDDVALVYFGDGATSTADFHVGMNFAGVFKVPAVFLCRNNQWAISMPVSAQTAAVSIAVKAQAYGFEGVQVDGNDVFAVVSATQQAVQRARAGNGPTLIEALTYRLSAHSTSDDPRAYRKEKEVEEWSRKDPLIRLKAYLIGQGLWSKQLDKALEEEIRLEIQETVKRAESVGPPPLSTMFEDVYDQMPWNLREQYKELTRTEQVPALEKKA